MKALILFVTGVVGLVEAVLPRAAVRAWTLAVYRNAADAEPREWVYTAARVEGAVLVSVSLVGLYRAATARESDGTDTDETTTTDRSAA